MKKIIIILISYFGCITTLFAQKKFETTIGISYNDSHYKNYPSSNYSSYLEKPFATDGLGLTVKEEYYLLKNFSLQTGIELINTKIAFNEITIGSNIPSGTKYRHDLNIYELQFPLTTKINSNSYKGFRGYILGGIAFRTVPYSSVKINLLSGDKLYEGKAYTKIHNNRFSPQWAVGMDYSIGKKMLLFSEFCLSYTPGSYFYAGQDNNEKITDTLIDNKRFASFIIGIKL